MPRQAWVGAISSAVVALALFSACGGGGGGTAAATHPPEATGSETSGAPAISKEKAEALSSSMLLRLTDFPAGWRAEPTDEQDSCAGIDRVTERYHVLGKAQSKTFAKGDSTEATSEAGLFRDKPTAREAMNYLEASIQSKRFRDCLDDYFAKQTNESVSFGKVSIGQASFPRMAERSSAWEIVIPVEAEGFSVTAYIDVVFMTRSNALAIVLFSDVFEPFDEQMREQLAGLVQMRMTDAVEML